MLKKSINFFLTLLVLVYILFEELVWEKLAKPIINLFLKLELFKNLVPKIQSLNTYVILIFFVFSFIFVELLGIYAGVIFVLGHIYLGVFLYLLKILIAAFIFWFFALTKEKLLQFKWFAFIYEKLELLIGKIKSSSIYIKIKEKIAILKQEIKNRFFISKSRIKEKISKIYKLLKNKNHL
jgi:hypothetical protein